MDEEPTATIRVVWPFFAAIARLDRGPGAGPEQGGLRALRRGDPDARVPHSVLTRMIRTSDGPRHLGLLAAREVEPGDLDLFELVARSQSTLGDAMRCVQRLLPLLHEGWSMSLIEREGVTEARFTLKAGLELLPPHGDFLLALSVISAQRVTGRPGFRMSEVCFPYPRPVDLAPFERFFDCTLRFDQPFAALRLSTEALSLPLVHASPTVSAALDSVASQLLASRPGAFRSRVVLIIEEQLRSQHQCTAATVAKGLGMTVRTLQRRLEDEGTGFRTVLDDHRNRLAHAYLGQRNLSVAEVAYLLGFASTPAFHRAFKRWAGQTPAEFRAVAVAAD